MSPRPKIRAVLYARFSPRSNSDTCPSSEVQLADLRRHCEAKGYIIKGEFHDDAVSGKNAARVQFQEALKACARGDVFLVRDFKRFARSMIDTWLIANKLSRKGVRLESLHDGNYDPNDINGLMLFGIKSVIAECERRHTSKVTREKVNRYQNVDRRRMSAVDKVPYGQMVDPANAALLVDCPLEAPALARILELRAEGESYRDIADTLNHEGHKPRTGSAWSFSTIRNIVLRERRKALSKAS